MGETRRLTDLRSVAYTDLSRAGMRARRERSLIFCAGDTSLERPAVAETFVQHRSAVRFGAVLSGAAWTKTLATVWRVFLPSRLSSH